VLLAGLRAEAWGAIGTWVLTFVALLALAGSVVAVYYSYQQAKALQAQAQNLQTQVDLARQEQSQSRRVSAWLEMDQTDSNRLLVIIRNGSQEPIYRCRYSWDGKNWVFAEVVPPNYDNPEKTARTIRLSEPWDPNVSLPPLEIYFLDASRQGWKRPPGGAPEPLAASAPIFGPPKSPE